MCEQPIASKQDFAVSLVIEFFLFSVGGWIFEMIYSAIIEQRIVDRGFLFGPYCPIYGFAILAAVLLFGWIKNNVVLAVASALTVTVLEYVTSYVLELVYHWRWWDYSNMPFNLNGRICLIATVFFGLGTLFCVRVVHPWLQAQLHRIPERRRLAIAVVLVAILIADTIVTHIGLIAIRDTIDGLYTMISEQAQAAYSTVLE